jgi:transposase
LHLAVDAETGEIVASVLTSKEAGDAGQVPVLLEQVEGEIASVMADGAYDGEPVYRAIEGTVTRTGAKSQRPGCWARSGRSGRVLPRLHRLDPEGPKRAAGDEVALKVERVVDRSMGGQEPLS